MWVDRPTATVIYLLFYLLSLAPQASNDDETYFTGENILKQNNKLKYL